jgi:hypothetical protein
VHPIRLTLACALLALAPSLAQAQVEVEIDSGKPDVVGSEVLVVEVGAPGPSSVEHAFVADLAKKAHATTVFEGAYNMDQLVDAIADPRRKSGARPKISTLFFAGHMTYAPAAPGSTKLAPFVLAGALSYDAAMNQLFVGKLAAALEARGLTPDDVFAPGARVEFKVCNVARDTRPFLDALAGELPASAKLVAYDTEYTFETGREWSIFGIELGKLAFFQLGDQQAGQVEIAGHFDGHAAPAPVPPPTRGGSLEATTHARPAVVGNTEAESPRAGFVQALERQP